MTAKALSTTNWVELINKRKFTKAVVNRNSKTFVVHLLALEATEGILLSQAVQIAAL